MAAIAEREAAARQAIEDLCRTHKVSILPWNGADGLAAAVAKGLQYNAHLSLGNNRLRVEKLPTWQGEEETRQCAMLGGGSYGKVALGQLDGSLCAVKFFQDWTPAAALQQELEAQLRDILRSCFVRVLAVCFGAPEQGVPPMLVTELINLGGLHKRAWERNPGGSFVLDAAGLVCLCNEGVRLVAQMVQLGLIHRDFKLDNLLLGEVSDGRSKILKLWIGDVGLAQEPGVPRELVGAEPGSKPSHGNCDAHDPAAWVEGVLPANSDLFGLGVLLFQLLVSHEMVFYYCKLGHHLSAALLAQLASGGHIWCVALAKRGFRRDDEMHRLVLKLMQLCVGLKLQPDHNLRGSPASHRNVWSATTELMLASNKLGVGAAGAAQPDSSNMGASGSAPQRPSASSSLVRPSAAAMASIDDVCNLPAVIPDEELVIASANQSRSPLIEQILLLRAGAFDGRSLGQKTLQSVLVSGVQEVLQTLKGPLSISAVRRAFALNQGVQPEAIESLSIKKLSELLEVRPHCLFLDLPAEAAPAMPSFVYRGALEAGGSDAEVCRLNRADCRALVAVAQQGQARLAAVRAALLKWSAWRGKMVPLHVSGGSVMVQLRLDNRLPEARMANGSWFSLSVVLPAKP